MHCEKGAVQNNDLNEMQSLAFSWSTVDSLPQRPSFESIEDSNELEERIIEYMLEKKLEFFTDPTLKEIKYNQEQREKLVIIQIYFQVSKDNQPLFHQKKFSSFKKINSDLILNGRD